MPFRSSQLNCPSCGDSAQLVHHTNGANCSSCGGWFFDEKKLLDALHEAHPEQLIELVKNNGLSPRRPCPTCQAMMNVVWLDFLQLDRCNLHGVWLDKGELERAVRWDDVIRPLTETD